MIVSVLGPWIVFAVVLAARAWLCSLDDTMNLVSWAICLFILVVVLVICCPPLLKGGDLGHYFSWGWLLLVTVIAWIAGFAYGDSIYAANFKPYNDLSNLNIYPSVDPGLYKAQQLMDAGQIEFLPGSHLDLTRSYGFKNEDIYCVAPIVGPKQNKTNNKTLAQYDYWAIGTNCCSAHITDYHCGEYSNVNAHKGLRLMNDGMRGYFRLAVEEATAAYGIKAPQPIFVYWMESPADELHAYNEDGFKSMETGIIVSLLVLVGIVAFTVICARWSSLL